MKIAVVQLQGLAAIAAEHRDRRDSDRDAHHDVTPCRDMCLLSVLKCQARSGQRYFWSDLDLARSGDYTDIPDLGLDLL